MFTRDLSPSHSETHDPERTYRQIQEITEQIAITESWIDAVRQAMKTIIIGLDLLTDRLLISLLTGGHILLDGPSGTAKSLALKAVAQLINVDAKRITLSPDMQSSDLLGMEIFHQHEGAFSLKQGPIFTSMLLIDDLNRAPATVHAALMEAMQDQQVTIGTGCFTLPELFLVLATQSSNHHEGIYPLAQRLADRFMMKISIPFPTPEEERRIIELKDHANLAVNLTPRVEKEQLLASRAVVNTIYLDDKMKDYIVSLVYASRKPETFGLDLAPFIESGASPRATINLKQAARGWAYLAGRGFVTPDDVKNAARDVLPHRLHVSFEADAAAVDGNDLVRSILDAVPIP